MFFEMNSLGDVHHVVTQGQDKGGTYSPPSDVTVKVATTAPCIIDSGQAKREADLKSTGVKKWKVIERQLRNVQYMNKRLKQIFIELIVENTRGTKLFASDRSKDKAWAKISKERSAELKESYNKGFIDTILAKTTEEDVGRILKDKVAGPSVPDPKQKEVQILIEADVRKKLELIVREHLKRLIMAS